MLVSLIIHILLKVGRADLKVGGRLGEGGDEKRVTAFRSESGIRDWMGHWRIKWQRNFTYKPYVPITFAMHIIYIDQLL